MTKKKLIDDIKINPSRFYRAPADVIRDRRFCDEERLEILDAWKYEASETQDDAATSLLQQLADAKMELKRRHDSASHN
jgi:hypothetical protein